MKTSLIANERVYAANDGTAASYIDKAKHLKRGAIAFYDASGTLIAHNASSITGNFVYVCVGLGDGRVFNSNPIVRSKFYYNSAANVAAVKKKMIVGGDGTSYSLNLPGTINAGDTATFHIYNLSSYDPHVNYELVNVTMVGGESATEIVTKCVTAINSISSLATATAKATDKGITFDSTNGEDFTVTVSGIIGNADILEYQMVNKIYTAAYNSATHVVAHNVGRGTYDQVLAAEKYTWNTRGDGSYNNDGNAELYRETSLVLSTIDYHQYNCEYVNDDRPLKKSNDFVNELTVYCNDDVATPLVTDVVTAVGVILALI